MRRMMLVGGAVALMLVAAACGDDSDSSSATTAGGAATTGAAAATTAAAPATTAAAAATPTEVKIGMADYSYSDVPATVTGGAVTVTANEQRPTEEHQATILRLNDGVTLQQALGDFAADPNKGFCRRSSSSAARTPRRPARRSRRRRTLPGWQLRVRVPDPRHRRHPARGEGHARRRSRSPSRPARPRQRRRNDGEIVTNEYSFTDPGRLLGKGTFEIVNQGEQNHEMAVYKIAEGKTARRRAGVLLVDEPPAGPPPITPSGGISAAAPGTSMLSTLDLSSGNYVMMCFLPDVKTGAPHFTLGMIQAFTVS